MPCILDLWGWLIPKERWTVRGEQLDKVLRVCKLERRGVGEKDWKVRKRIIKALSEIE